MKQEWFLRRVCCLKNCGRGSRLPHHGLLGDWASGGLELARSLSWRSFTMPLCPFSVASKSGVSPSLSHGLGWTSLRSRSSFTILSCPYSAATNSGVLPCPVDQSGLTSLRSRSSFTIPSYPPSAAPNSAI